MRKPIAIAMTLSVGIHAVLLAMIAWDVDPAVPAIKTPLIVSLQSAGVSESDDRPSTDGTQEPLRAERAKTLIEDPEPEALAAASDDPPVVATAPVEAADTRDGEPAPDIFESSDATAAVSVESAQGLADAATPPNLPDPAVAENVTTASQSPVRTAQLTAKQQKMFARRIRDWAETYHKRRLPDDVLTWRYAGQRYRASFTALPGGDDQSLDRLMIRVSTDMDGNRLSTEMTMKRLAFSNYAQFVNRWDESVQIHDDELDGRFHSNSAINLTYSRKVKPQFRGKVTTSARTVNVTQRRGYMRRDEIFLGGLQTGVRSIRLPKHFIPLPDSAVIPRAQVQEFHEDTRITFHDDGSYSWVSLEDGLFERRGSIREPATYLIASGRTTLHVRGRVNGRVLVYSPERIVVLDDLMYADDPETVDDVDDYIGLVSEKTVEIAGPESTGPGDLRIHAAIYAKRRFSVARFRTKGEGTLEIFGSLTAGSLSATEPRYATRIRFDPRLESRRPPGFPVTDRYELESWDGAWIVHSAAPPTDRL